MVYQILFEMYFYYITKQSIFLAMEEQIIIQSGRQIGTLPDRREFYHFQGLLLPLEKYLSQITKQSKFQPMVKQIILQLGSRQTSREELLRGEGNSITFMIFHSLLKYVLSLLYKTKHAPAHGGADHFICYRQQAYKLERSSSSVEGNSITFKVCHSLLKYVLSLLYKTKHAFVHGGADHYIVRQADKQRGALVMLKRRPQL